MCVCVCNSLHRRKKRFRNAGIANHKQITNDAPAWALNRYNGKLKNRDARILPGGGEEGAKERGEKQRACPGVCTPGSRSSLHRYGVALSVCTRPPGRVAGQRTTHVTPHERNWREYVPIPWKDRAQEVVISPVESGLDVMFLGCDAVVSRLLAR